MRTIAITSGKGGVGKTTLSTNLGIALRQMGQRVVLFDADLGLANLDVMMGVRARYTLENVLAGEVPLAEAVSEGPGGVRFIAGGSGVEALVNLDTRHLHLFLSELMNLESSTDWLIFDTGAGIDRNVMAFLQASDQVLLVVTPDPSSMLDAYATAKVLWSHSTSAKVKIIPNSVRDEAEGKAIYAKLFSICKQFLNQGPDYGGFVRYDPKAAACVRKRVPFVLEDTELPASRDVAAIAAGLLDRQVGPTAAGGFAKRFMQMLGLRRVA